MKLNSYKEMINALVDILLEHTSTLIQKLEMKTITYKISLKTNAGLWKSMKFFELSKAFR